jgi:hydroxymethylpyrimidine pyrophosphatase-like HAD family hydrolase
VGYRALASDYDGTLADSGRVGEGTVSALRRLLASGRQLLLVTGRRLDDLLGVFPEAASLAAAIVAENGAVLWQRQAQSVTPLASQPGPEFAAALRRQGVPVSEGAVVVASVDPYGPVIADTIRSMGLELELARNKGAIMALPAGVDKGSGLGAALSRLGLAADQVVGVGDAENDESFLRLCGYAVAVGDALPAVRRQADLCLERPDGAGVSELINMMLAGRLPSQPARSGPGDPIRACKSS